MKLRKSFRRQVHLIQSRVKVSSFKNVQVFKTQVPIGPWPKDERLKRISKLMWAQGINLRLFQTVLGWTQEQLQVVLIEARPEMKNQRTHTHTLRCLSRAVAGTEYRHDCRYNVVGQKQGSSTAVSVDAY